MNENMKRTTIILARHGECEGNKEGRFRGQKDFPLNSRGLIQVADLGRALKKFSPERIFTSPLLRARQTAEAIKKECLCDVTVKSGITNITLGAWEGQLKSEIAEKFPNEWNLWLTTPEKLHFEGMESFQELQKRTYRTLNDLVSQNSGGTFVVVSHRTVLKPLIAACLGISEPYFWKIHFDTAAYSILAHEPTRGYSLVQSNITAHLRKYLSEWD